jgi:hypothetical protein
MGLNFIWLFSAKSLMLSAIDNISQTDRGPWDYLYRAVVSSTNFVVNLQSIRTSLYIRHYREQYHTQFCSVGNSAIGTFLSRQSSGNSDCLHFVIERNADTQFIRTGFILSFWMFPVSILWSMHACDQNHWRNQYGRSGRYLSLLHVNCLKNGLN